MCPFIECHTYNVNDFTSDPDLIIKKFKRFIDDGLYIYTFVNEKYIPQYLTSKDVIQHSGFNAYVQSFPKSVHLCSGPILYVEIMEYNLKGDYSQYKNLFILIEHAKILLLASKFCYENSMASKEVISKFESLIPMFSTVLGLYLKESLVEKEKKDLLLIRTNKYLKNAMDRKYMILNEFYNELQKYSC